MRRAAALALLAGAAALAGCGASGPRAPHTAVLTGPRTTLAAQRPAPALRHGPRGTEAVPILMYHVIAPAPPGAPFPGLYTTAADFTDQMRALAAAGYHAVTMTQMWDNWRDGTPLPRGRPIVISFDNGYWTQATVALPVLARLGWPGVENIQLTGLPPSQGGLSRRQVRLMIHDGWELDTQGNSHADLITLDQAQLRFQIADARRTLQERYHVPVRWFCYPSGHYDPTVIAAVRAAGFLGATTVLHGWASPGEDPYALPRLEVLAGWSGAELLAQIDGMRGLPAPGTHYP